MVRSLLRRTSDRFSARYSVGKSRIIAGVVRAAATVSQRLGYQNAA
jgi:hypothetical protein